MDTPFLTIDLIAARPAGEIAAEMMSRSPTSAAGVGIRRGPLAALGVAAVLFGVTPTVTKFALGGFGPVTLLGVELLAATVALWTILLKRGYRAPRSWRRVICLGILEPGIAYLLVSFGLGLTTASNAALLSALESGFVVVLAAIFLHERAGWSLITAGLIAVLGMVVLEGSVSFGPPGMGDLMVAVGSLSAAASTIVARRIAEEGDPLAVTAHQFAVATALVVPLTVVRWAAGAEALPVGVPLRFWAVAALAGIFGFGASFALYNTAIVSVAAGPAGVIINLAPAFGLASAVIWLGETLTLGRVLGALLIAVSVGLFISVDRGITLTKRLVKY